MRALRVIGLDPGLRVTGWGVIDVAGNRLSHVANGVVRADPALDLAERLVELQRGLVAVMQEHQPQAAAVEVTLANKNATSTLKLGMARGIALVTAASSGIRVGEYLPMIVKKSVVGTGHAKKPQVAMMVSRLLPGCGIVAADSADALAVAICHAHHLESHSRWQAPAAQLAEGGAR